MIASATPSNTSLARRIAQRAGEFKDRIGLDLGNFIAAASAVVVAGTLTAKSVSVSHATLTDTADGYATLLFGKADIWITAVALVFASTMALTWALSLIVEKTLLRQERSSADQAALVLIALMCASIITFVAMNHLGDIARALAWVIYEFQLHIVGFDNVVTSVPDNVA